MYSLARIAERNGRPEHAVKTHFDILKLNPNYGPSLHRLGVISCQRANFDQAMDFFNRAVDAGQPSAELMGDIGFALYLQGDLLAATDTLRRAAEIEPSNKRILNNLAVVLGSQKQYKDSVNLFRQTGTEAESLAGLAFVQSQTGQIADAKTNYHRALELDSKLTVAANGLIELNRAPENAIISPNTQMVAQVPSQPQFQVVSPAPKIVIPQVESQTNPSPTVVTASFSDAVVAPNPADGGFEKLAISSIEKVASNPVAKVVSPQVEIPTKQNKTAITANFSDTPVAGDTTGDNGVEKLQISAMELNQKQIAGSSKVSNRRPPQQQSNPQRAVQANFNSPEVSPQPREPRGLLSPMKELSLGGNKTNNQPLKIKASTPLASGQIIVGSVENSAMATQKFASSLSAASVPTPDLEEVISSSPPFARSIEPRTTVVPKQDFAAANPLQKPNIELPEKDLEAFEQSGLEASTRRLPTPLTIQTDSVETTTPANSIQMNVLPEGSSVPIHVFPGSQNQSKHGGVIQASFDTELDFRPPEIKSIQGEFEANQSLKNSEQDNSSSRRSTPLDFSLNENPQAPMADTIRFFQPSRFSDQRTDSRDSLNGVQSSRRRD